MECVYIGEKFGPSAASLIHLYLLLYIKVPEILEKSVHNKKMQLNCKK